MHRQIFMVGPAWLTELGSWIT